MSEVGAQTPTAASPFAPATARTEIGVVAIGRNEGDRLRQCLESIGALAHHAVYVDSGSTDGSPEMARGLGVDVVDLDMGIPFTAARARNEGLRRLKQRMPGVRYVQFVDGDCEVVAGWMTTAAAFLDVHPRVAAACGRRRERHPENSVYNRLCDIEWNTPIGEAGGCGGDALMRADALGEVGGYRDAMIAAEDSELCVRLRLKGWQIWRLDAEMTVHDAAITRIGQWWKRAKRAGYAFAEGAVLHGALPERFFVRESRSALLWGAVIPLAIVASTLLAGPMALWAWMIYPLQVLKLFLRGSGGARARAERALFLTLGKFAEASGQLKYFAHRLSGTRGRIIEYK